MIDRNPILEFKNVYKSYKIKAFLSTKEKTVLNGVSFELYPGEIVGILGVNGAGKTTIIKIISGITKQDRGDVKIFSKDISDRSYLNNIGYLSEIPYFSQNFTVKETIEFFNSLSLNKTSYEKLHELYESFSIKSFLNEKIKNLSKGMLQKVALAISIVNNPQLLVLDEPTTGLDPITSDLINELIIKLNNELKTTTISITHDLRSAIKIAKRIILLQDGYKVFDGSVEEALNTDIEEMRKFREYFGQ